MAQNALNLFKQIKNDPDLTADRLTRSFVRFPEGYSIPQPVYQSQGEMRSYEPTTSDYASQYIGNALGDTEMGRNSVNALKNTVPAYYTATELEEAGRTAAQGNLLGTAEHLGLAALGAVPFAGPRIARYMREPNITLNATHEAIPAANSGHVPQILNAPLEEKLAYTNEGSWTKDGIDALYRTLGKEQRPTTRSTGMYLNENQPLDISHVIFDNDVTAQEVIPTVEHFRGLVDAQGASGAHMIDTSLSGTGALLNMKGKQPTGEQLSKLSDVLNPQGFGISSSQRGAVIYPFTDTPLEVADDLYAQVGPQLKEVFPNAKIQRGKATGFYEPAMDKFDANYNQVPTTGQGEATSAFLNKAAQADPLVAERLSQDPEIRNIINQKLERDNRLGGARQDVQHMREFFRDADWNKAVELIRQGVPPATALAALGYSLSAMADERPKASR